MTSKWRREAGSSRERAYHTLRLTYAYPGSVLGSGGMEAVDANVVTDEAADVCEKTDGARDEAALDVASDGGVICWCVAC